VLAPTGLIRVNGIIIRKCDFHLQPGDFIQWEWLTIYHFRSYFRPYYLLQAREETVKNAGLPKNIMYLNSLHAAIYMQPVRITDIALSSHLNSVFFLWFALESKFGR
jgi:hypothetical protein